MNLDTGLVMFAFGILLGIILYLRKRLATFERRLDDASRVLSVYTALLGGRVSIEGKMTDQVNQLHFGRRKDVYILATTPEMSGKYLCLNGDLKKMTAAMRAAIPQLMGKTEQEAE